VASLILLLAVVGKVSLLLSDPFVPVSLGFSSRGLAWLVAFSELLVLAVCQFSLSRFWASNLLIAVYFGFSVHGIFSLLEGRTSCGWFGVVEMPIWQSFSISLMCLLLLTLARFIVWHQGDQSIKHDRFGSQMSPSFTPRRYGWGIGVFMSLIVGILVFEADELFEKLPIKFEYNGPLVLCTGVENEVDLILRNQALHPVRVVGIKSSCQCIAADALFREVSPGSTEIVKVRIKLNQAGPFRQQILLYFDAGNKSRMLVALNGTAIDSAL
jgi:hypothetical protein